VPDAGGGGGVPDAGGSGGGGEPDAGGGGTDGGSAGGFRINVHLAGQGGGRVESAPAGISCPGQCSASFPQGEVKLISSANAGSGFAYWTGGCLNSDASCTINVWHDFEVWATFEPPPPVTYSVRVIPKANTAYSVNAAGNATGVGYGGAHTSDGDAFLFVAATGQTSFLTFSANEQSHAQGINDRNAIVANVMPNRTGNNSSRAVRWENGVTTELGTLGGNTWGYGINASNQVVGWYVHPNGRGGTFTRAFLHDGQRMIDLGSLDGTCSEAHAIDRTGTAVGSSCSGAMGHAVVFHQGGAIEDLTPSTYGAADGISDAGYIVGRAGPDGFIRAPDGSMRDVGSLPSGSGSWLHGVNDAGVAVGFGLVPAYAPKGYLTNTSRAAVWLGGRLWDLSYLTGRSDTSLSEAFGINASGQIVARGYVPNSDGWSVLLTPR
jgi:probable HAF family extracellular repeat protein